MLQLEITADVIGMPAGMEAMLMRVGAFTVCEERLQGNFQAAFILTDDEGIAAINREQRGVDAPTDVLSFPSVRYPSGTARDNMKRLRREIDPQTRCMHIGDIVISLPRAQEQAQQYGHALTREIGFLTVHGLLHLLGYDHDTQERCAAMRAMEERIMDKSGLSRELTDADFALIAGAREAMQRAYAPYSKYRVGACVRTVDGDIFQGCNVENASYGMALCAERNAITTAVMQGMKTIEAIAIAAEGAMPYPCGACRQVMREFARDLRVIVVNEEEMDITTLGALLPSSFGPESLEEVERV